MGLVKWLSDETMVVSRENIPSGPRKGGEVVD